MSGFQFPDEVLSQHLAIVGKVGSGKTYAGKGIVERLLAHQRRVCILDPTGVWWGLRSNASGKGAGFPVVIFGGPHADVPIAETTGEALAKVIADKNLPAIVDLSEMLIGARHRFATDFAAELYRLNRSPLHLVIDEADEFAPQNPLPETKRMLHQFDRIVRRGRVRGFRIMLITQRPAVLHKNVLTQCNTLVAMRLTAPQDRNAIKAWIEGQADAAQGRTVLDSLPRLQRGEGWVWAPELDVLERTAFPKISTFDSSRTPDDDEKVLEPTKLAAVDLSEIKASFAGIEKDAKSLVELKAELVKVRGELAKALKGKGLAPAPGPDEAAIERRISKGIENAMKLLPSPPPFVSKALVAAIERIAAGLQAVQAELAGVDIGVVPRARTVAHALAASERMEPIRAANGNRPNPVAAPRETASISGIRAGAVRILQELAARAPAGYSLAQVGGLTQFSVKGGTFRTYMGDLRRGGFIVERDGLVFASEGGIMALGDRVPDAPTTHDAAMDLWRRALRKGAHEMLQAIVAGGAEGLATDELAAQVGMEPSGGTFRTYLGDLRRNGLITTNGGHAVANDILWPERA